MKVLTKRVRGALIASLLISLFAVSAVNANPLPDPYPSAPQEAALQEVLPGMSQIRTSHPLYQVYLEIGLLRKSAEEAAEYIESIELLDVITNEQIDAALFVATVASSKALHAANSSVQWEVDLFISQEAAQREFLDVLAVSPQDPSAYMDISQWVESESIYKESQRRETQLLTIDANEKVKEAEKILANVAKLRAQANEDSQKALDLLYATQEKLNALQGQSMAYQTVVSPDGCPVEVPVETLREYDGTVWGLCARSVAQAPTIEAALAIKYAFRALGAPYACDENSRYDSFAYDCSSLVVRSYAKGASMSSILAEQTTITTRQMVPWGGGVLASWLTDIPDDALKPGDLVLYDLGHADTRHVVLMLADGMMLHTDECGDVAHVRKFWGTQPPDYAKYLGSRRVVTANT